MSKSNRKKVVAAGIFAGLLVLSVFALTTATTAAPMEKIEICHCTQGNPPPDAPWVIIEVNRNSWVDNYGQGHNHTHQCPDDSYDVEYLGGQCGHVDYVPQ